MKSSFEPVIGLEIHIQLQTDSKIFCSCPTTFDDMSPNEATCPICLGHPGTLPQLNEKVIEQGIVAAKAINADVSDVISFDRKHYFYPDLPKNFQITQHDTPLCTDGEIELEDRSITVRSAHLEEDPGSIVYESEDLTKSDRTFIDYNRSGVPLMEFVTDPEIKSPEEARASVEKLVNQLSYLNVMDETRSGAVRVDANISVRNQDGPNSSRSEIKNIGSPTGAESALSYEINRQKNMIRRGSSEPETTRHWDDSRGVTVELRQKESDSDYRHFKEYDIPEIALETL